ncbi:hypothetical protein C0Q70_11169 [Pomacea canaliculata]|uniref:Uncharacterized protein n=1 Tax=Pomacea canaliculata TaxID=400727 RepID=A0A2T7P596_POMCA|nr:hypothetical protein C0Q70_11169 [Pomacea canaliculata]
MPQEKASSPAPIPQFRETSLKLSLSISQAWNDCRRRPDRSREAEFRRGIRRKGTAPLVKSQLTLTQRGTDRTRPPHGVRHDLHVWAESLVPALAFCACFGEFFQEPSTIEVGEVTLDTTVRPTFETSASQKIKPDLNRYLSLEDYINVNGVASRSQNVLTTHA